MFSLRLVFSFRLEFGLTLGLSLALGPGDHFVRFFARLQDQFVGGAPDHGLEMDAMYEWLRIGIVPLAHFAFCIPLFSDRIDFKVMLGIHRVPQDIRDLFPEKTRAVMDRQVRIPGFLRGC